MQNLNGDFNKLCAELQRNVLEELSLPDLMSFAKTRMENNKGVKEYMDERCKALFKRFVDDVGAFINLIEQTGSVISGIEEAVMRHFKDTEGYEVMNTVLRKKEYDSSAITKITKLAKGKNKIDVIITNWASAIVPILQYHSTAVMNYITAHSLISLYPTWTAEKKSLNKSAHGTHDCYQSAYCPGTTRNTIDEDTLHWEFSPMNTIGKTKIACDEMAVIPNLPGVQEHFHSVCESEGLSSGDQPRAITERLETSDPGPLKREIRGKKRDSVK
ncbi:hypothetical protein DFH29DRAFT_876203 [Suillus ampliporus]|nr:hypothetical protein DFH29DRAFT_876203 [Suillus ampliporus]